MISTVLIDNINEDSHVEGSLKSNSSTFSYYTPH